MTGDRDAGPGPRREIGGQQGSRVQPHVTENDEGAPVQGSTQAPNPVPVLPANAHGQDRTPTGAGAEYIDDESMYEKRPGENKDRAETDMP